MRLLLIFALLLASVTFGPPASAQAHHGDAQHHSHAADGHNQHGGHDDGRDDGGQAVAHVCPGCAVFDPLLVADAGSVSHALPRLPANPLSPTSFHANPIPPPPRTS